VFCCDAQVKALQAQVEQEQQKKSALQSEVGLVSSEAAHLRARETQLTREVTQLREGKKSVEEELHKVKTARSVDDLQMKELQDQLEAEQYFSVCFLNHGTVVTITASKGV
jgi:chromosome segregation ATPase